jgi:anti-sigma regulatory factor (Ser/Thr protein kinase)
MVGKVVSNISGAGGSATVGGIAYLELQFRPDLSLVTVTRRFIARLYGRLLTDPADTSRLALATHELLENAVKYSMDSETQLSIDVSRHPDHMIVEVRTNNRAEPGDIATVRRIFDELKSASDAFAFYQEVIDKSSREPNESGLGLARIAAEADMTMDHVVEGDSLTIVSRCRVDLQEGGR